MKSKQIIYLQINPLTSTCTNFLYASKDSQTAETRPWSLHCQLHILSNIANCQILRRSILSPLVEQQPTYIKDSNHAINIFSTFRFQGEHCFLFSMDIKSLYTSIPHEDGLIALRHFLGQRPDPEPPTNTLIRLAELVLQKNFFSFNGSFYVQKSGVAMGSNLGRSLPAFL